MLRSWKYVDLTIPRSENEVRTSEAFIEEPINGDVMNKPKFEEVTNAQKKPDTCQKKHRKAKGWANNEVKGPEVVTKSSSK